MASVDKLQSNSSHKNDCINRVPLRKAPTAKISEYNGGVFLESNNFSNIKSDQVGLNEVLNLANDYIQNNSSFVKPALISQQIPHKLQPKYYIKERKPTFTQRGTIQASKYPNTSFSSISTNQSSSYLVNNTVLGVSTSSLELSPQSARNFFNNNTVYGNEKQNAFTVKKKKSPTTFVPNNMNARIQLKPNSSETKKLRHGNLETMQKITRSTEECSSNLNADFSINIPKKSKETVHHLSRIQRRSSDDVLDRHNDNDLEKYTKLLTNTCMVKSADFKSNAEYVSSHEIGILQRSSQPQLDFHKKAGYILFDDAISNATIPLNMIKMKQLSSRKLRISLPDELVVYFVLFENDLVCRSWKSVIASYMDCPQSSNVTPMNEGTTKRSIAGDLFKKWINYKLPNQSLNSDSVVSSSSGVSSLSSKCSRVGMDCSEVRLINSCLANCHFSDDPKDVPLILDVLMSVLENFYPLVSGLYRLSSRGVDIRTAADLLSKPINSIERADVEKAFTHPKELANLVKALLQSSSPKLLSEEVLSVLLETVQFCALTNYSSRCGSEPGLSQRNGAALAVQHRQSTSTSQSQDWSGTSAPHDQDTATKTTTTTEDCGRGTVTGMSSDQHNQPAGNSTAHAFSVQIDAEALKRLLALLRLGRMPVSRRASGTGSSALMVSTSPTEENSTCRCIGKWKSAGSRYQTIMFHCLRRVCRHVALMSRHSSFQAQRLDVIGLASMLGINLHSSSDQHIITYTNKLVAALSGQFEWYFDESLPESSSMSAAVPLGPSPDNSPLPDRDLAAEGADWPAGLHSTQHKAVIDFVMSRLSLAKVRSPDLCDSAPTSQSADFPFNAPSSFSFSFPTGGPNSTGGHGLTSADSPAPVMRSKEVDIDQAVAAQRRLLLQQQQQPSPPHHPSPASQFTPFVKQPMVVRGALRPNENPPGTANHEAGQMNSPRAAPRLSSSCSRPISADLHSAATMEADCDTQLALQQKFETLAANPALCDRLLTRMEFNHAAHIQMPMIELGGVGDMVSEDQLVWTAQPDQLEARISRLVTESGASEQELARRMHRIFDSLDLSAPSSPPPPPPPPQTSIEAAQQALP